MDTFAAKYQAKYPKAVTCLTKDREALLAFYDFPAEHWQHIRTTNPIESVFATVRHRTVRSKGCLSHNTALAMVFKLVTAASKTWRRLNGYEKLPRVIQGVKFTDGIQADETETRAAAGSLPRRPLGAPQRPEDRPPQPVSGPCSLLRRRPFDSRAGGSQCKRSGPLPVLPAESRALRAARRSVPRLPPSPKSG